MRNRVLASAAAAGICVLSAAAVQAKTVSVAASGSQAEYAVAYQINPAHSGNINFAAGFSTPLTQIWSVTLDSSLSYPVVAGGRVFVNSSSGVTYALDLTTGATRWSENTGVTFGPAYDRGSLFLLGSHALLTSLSAKSGKTLWTFQSPQSFANAAPTAQNGQVFVGASGDGADLYDVDETSGTVVWDSYFPDGDSNSSPAYGEDGIYYSDDCEQYKLAFSSGDVDWTDYEYCDGGGTDLPVYDAKRLYIQISSNGGANYALDADTGSFVGTFGADAGDPPAFWKVSNGKNLGFGLVDGYLYGWNVAKGTNVWSFAGDNQLSTPPIVINGLVVEGSGSGNVYLLDAGTGTQEWSGTTGAGVTALGAGQGTLVVISGSIVTAYVPQSQAINREPGQ